MFNRCTIRVCLLVIFVAGCSERLQPPTKDVDWPVYLGDAGRSHYSTLTDINKHNVDQLQEVWRYNSGALRGSNSTMYTSPLVVNGILYGLSPQLKLFALKAASGERLWEYDPELPGAAQRGLMHWQPAQGSARIYYTVGSVLLAVDATNGKAVSGFGEEGRLQLRPEGGRAGSSVAVTVPGVVYGDLLIFGFSTNEDANAFPGSVRAFRARDGELLWQFDTIPRPGAPGSETWAEGSLANAGGANVWTGMALDVERGILFAPTGSATPDFYGAGRLGDNLYANSLLAIDANTGELLWHFQMFRHDLWDRDNPSPPTLVQVPREGGVVDAVAITTKSGQLFVFNRETGESLFPIEEQTTLPSTLPGEQAAASQPVSSITFSRQKFAITERTPEARAAVQARIKGWDLRPWAPPKLGTVLIYPWYDGGAEWGGSAFDPMRGRLVLNAQDAAGVLSMSQIPIGFSQSATYLRHCGSCHGASLEGSDAGPALADIYARKSYPEVVKIVNEGAGRMPAFAHLSDIERRAIMRQLAAEEMVPDPPSTEVEYVFSSGYNYLKDHEGLPGNSGPWGTLNSIDLQTGEVVWQVPFGNFLSHPELGMGALSYGGPVVTAAGLIFIAATPDKYLSAYDSEDGTRLWQAELPAAGFSTPAVYRADGRQFVVVAAGGGRLGPPSSAEYVAFSLPVELNEGPTSEKSSYEH